eukprot:s4451_g6.t1
MSTLHGKSNNWNLASGLLTQHKLLSIRWFRELAYAFMDELSKPSRFSWQDELVDHASKISSEAQPRRTKGPLLLSEFKTKVVLECLESDNPPVVIPEDAMPPWQGIPVGSKRLDIQPLGSEVGVVGRLKVVPLPLDEANMSSIAFILENGPSEVRYRSAKLKHYSQGAQDLQQDEIKLRNQMDESVNKVMGSKRVLLFKEMLQDAGVNDEHLSAKCAMVSDWLPSGQFQPQWKPATLGVEQLRQTAGWSQKAVVASCKRVLEDEEIAAAVWAETLEQAEADKCWVKGTFSADEITAKHGSQWVPSRRFGVRQGGKIRAVDDFSQLLVNSTVTCHEKIDLEGIDRICSTARFSLGAMREESMWCMPHFEGVQTGELADAWKNALARDLLGRCLGLRQAYKQLVRHPEDSWASILAVVNPQDGAVYFFEAIAFPHGSVSSVLAFNRAAKALRMILARVFKLVVTIFFDDFCQLELAPLCEGSWKTAELVLKMLGWRISIGDDKRKPFAKTFEILGAVICLPKAGCDVIEAANKESRLLQLKEQVDELKTMLRATAPIGRNWNPSKGDFFMQLVGAGLAECPPVLVLTDGAVEEAPAKVTHGAVLVDPSKQCSFFFGDHIPKEFVELWTHSGKKQVIAQAKIFPV